MSKFKKIDKEYLLSDSSLNCYGFRLLTSGYQLSEYKKNPIGYRMHNREDGVVLRWEDLRIDGDKLFGKPVINLSHPKGEQTVDEVENGFLNAASVGHLVALEISKDPKDYLPNQKGPTVTKWYNRECSLVDIPGNYNALTDLVDENDNKINLSDFKPQNINMEQIILTAAQLAMIPNLKADAKQADVDTAIADLVAKAGQVDTMKTAKEKAEKDLSDFKTAAEEAEADALLTAALNDKKMTVEMKNVMAVQFKGNLAGLKAVVATMKPYESKVPPAGAGDDATELDKLSAKSYSELDKSGELPKLKALSLDVFKAKYKENFKKDYTGE